MDYACMCNTYSEKVIVLAHPISQLVLYNNLLFTHWSTCKAFYWYPINLSNPLRLVLLLSFNSRGDSSLESLNDLPSVPEHAKTLLKCHHRISISWFVDAVFPPIKQYFQSLTLQGKIMEKNNICPWNECPYLPTAFNFLDYRKNIQCITNK